MEVGALLIFVLVYLGMILGFWPGFALDRTGIALLGAIAFIELHGISISQAASYIDLSALAILFSFMIISAQFFYGGFYTYIVDRMGKGKLTPSQLLLAVVFISAGLSAVLINDIVCLALTPLIIKVCFQKKLNPTPFLLGLACASNVGSALTLIGNPQNLLIGQVLNISFAQYLKFSLIPCLLGLMAIWMVIKLQVKGKWFHENQAVDLEAIPFDWWQSTKGIATILIILLIFLFTDMPRDQVSLIGAGFLLLSRRMASQTMLSFIDWQLLVLFIGLFIVNRSFLSTNQADYFLNLLKTWHIDLQSPLSLTLVAFILSNLVSNVPAVMLLLPFVNTDFNGSLLALSSTLAGNLFIVGSIANLIVISQASRFGIKLNWKIHAKVGLPITLITFFLAGGWLYLTA